MDKKYTPSKFEDKIYKSWEKAKAFTPKRNTKQPPFCIIMPPPNANAPLHIGHAMFVTLEDIMTRFKRMQGFSSLWLPGADHAGILTQVVFERHLAKKGKTRFDLGRTKFFKQCFKFTQDNKKIMYCQLKKLGASCDWSREKFTLNRKISEQVLLTFIDLYKNGLAYRGKRLINWCPRCMTALSDLEVEHKEVKSKFWYIKYPLKTRSSITNQTIFIIVATTRPETMLGDTAVAIHPNDKRYKKFIGQKAVLPIVKREIPVIADKSIDPEFGTGVVKITPAHDAADWQMGLKHKLKTIVVVGFDNKMTARAGKDFAGLKVLEAREKVVETLNSQNLLIKVRSHSHFVGHCERCKTIIEPLVSKQWFVNVGGKLEVRSAKLKKALGRKRVSLKELGILAVKKNLITILPKRFRKNYFNWLNNLYDWCISRQLWWGHRMPVWYCGVKGLSDLQKKMNPGLAKKSEGCGHVIVSLEKPKSCPKCRKRKTIIQDPDTFDTWFSSSQWPYTALGFDASRLKQKTKNKPSSRTFGPSSYREAQVEGKLKTNDFDYFYPTSVLETGYEIIFLWVSRMIMMGLYRTSNIPFKTVYLHGMVRDAFGEKMSKSKGNAIDPLGIIEKYGADSLRMALVVGAASGNDVSVTEEKIKGYRNFTNKVWNIGRFIEMGFKSTRKKIPWYKNNIEGLSKKDRKIVKKLNQLILQVSQDLKNYKFSMAGEAVYQFLWHEFADKYIEYSKTRVGNKDKAVLSVLRHVYINCLKLLHPFMPFVTEAVWQQFASWHKYPGGVEKKLITSSWPKVE